ncbi:thyroid receptor-interacting protein 11-like isoform X2 [Symsagittifera roscoffensis]|uniref:thyroid receptor-interacting protein 11-like isoform X2 n=1 Tax=Symsagittifera roscoffensis TaxID=84072 RepID=UPI00307BD8FE
MSWFSRTNITSLTGQFTDQLSSFTRDVLTEEEDEGQTGSSNDVVPIDEVNDLAAACKRIEELERTAAKLREETIRYQKLASQNEQRANSYEKELDRISNQHIEAIQEKDFAIKKLQKQLEEFKSNLNSGNNDSVISNINTSSTWSNFDWQADTSDITVTSEQAVFETPDLLVPETADGTSFKLEKLQQENENLRLELEELETFQTEKFEALETSHKEKIQSLEKFYKSKLECVKAENLAYQNSVSKSSDEFSQQTESLVQAENFSQTAEKREENAEVQTTDIQEAENEPNQSEFAIPNDFDPATHSSLEHYSCTVIQERMPALARALNEVILENHDLKQAMNNAPSVSMADDSDLQKHDHHQNSCGSSARSEGGSTIDSTSSWHLIASQGKPTTVVTTPSSPINDCSKPGSPVQIQFLNQGQQTEPAEDEEVKTPIVQSVITQLGFDFFEPLETKPGEDEKLSSENERLQSRIKELSIALELADQELQKIDIHAISSASQDQTLERRSNHSESSECVNCEDLKQTQFLLEESLLSNQKMEVVMEDQKLSLEELQENLNNLQVKNSKLVAKNQSLQDLTEELVTQISESEKNLEKLKQSQIEVLRNSENNEDLNQDNIDLSRSPEFQLTIVTELQNEVVSLKKKLKRSKIGLESGTGSKESPSPNLQTTFPLENSERSVLEQALLDKEEVIMRLNREIEGFKMTISELYRENNSRFETQSELISLKDQLIGLQSTLEKQEDQLIDKDFTIERLQQDFENLKSQHSEEIDALKSEVEKFQASCEDLGSKEKRLNVEISNLMQNLDVVTLKYEGILKMFSELSDDYFPQNENLKQIGNQESINCLLEEIKVALKENQDLKSVLESENEEKDQSVVKISELNSALKNVNSDLELERKSNLELREQIQEMMNKLSNVTNETNEYGLRLRQVSEKLASSIHEKCDLNTKINSLLLERELLLKSIEKLKAEKESLIKEITALQKELDDVKDVCEKLTVEIEELVSRNSEISDEVNRETAILHDDFYVKNERLHSEVSELKSKIASLENDLQNSEINKDEVLSQLEVKNNELAEVNVELKSVYAELESIFETSDCSEISKIVSWMKNETERIESECVSKTQQFIEISEEFESLKQEFRIKDKEFRSNEYKAKRLERDNDELKLKVQNLADKNEYSSDESKLLEEKNQSLAGTIEQLENYLQISEKKLSDTLSGDWEQRYEKERETVETQKSQILELRSLVEGYESQLNEALEDYESLKQRYNSVSERVSGNDRAFQEEISTLKEKISSATSEKLEFEKQIIDSRNEIESLTQQLQEMFNKVQKSEMVVNEKDNLIVSLNEKLSNTRDKLSTTEKSLQNLEQQTTEKLSEYQHVFEVKSELEESAEKLQTEIEKLRTKNEALSEILNENETGWNQKFKKQQEDFENYAQQAYQVRAHYDQLLFAYNEKTQLYSELEKTVETLREENSKLEEKLIDSSSMAPMTLSEPEICTEVVQNVTSSSGYPPDLVQISSAGGQKMAIEVLQKEINSKNDLISQLKVDISKEQEVVRAKNEELKKFEEKIADLTSQLALKSSQLQDMTSKNDKLAHELVRLRDHMLKIEEGYTMEALTAEEREKNLRTKLYQVEDHLQRLTSSSNVIDSELLSKMSEQEKQLTEVTSRANQLETQLEETSDQMRLYKDASQNLQMVLENFQKEQEREKHTLEETFDHRVQSLQEEKRQLESKVAKLTSRVGKQQELLEQAAHLSGEMELREEEIERLRGEVDAQMVQVTKWKKKAQEAVGVGEKVEKQLVRNLLVAYLTVPANKKTDALNMIARFLEFSEQEINKVGINAQRGWFSGWIPATPASSISQQNKQSINTENTEQESFTKKFIEFLENESTQPTVVSLPHHHLNPQTMGEMTIETGFGSSGKASQLSPASSTGSSSSTRFNFGAQSRPGDSKGGFNPFSPSVLPQLRPQHSPSPSLSGNSQSSLDDNSEQQSSSRHHFSNQHSGGSKTSQMTSSREGSRRSSNSSSVVQGGVGVSASGVVFTSGGQGYSSDDNSDSVSSSVSTRAENSFLKDLLKEH